MIRIAVKRALCVLKSEMNGKDNSVNAISELQPKHGDWQLKISPLISATFDDFVGFEFSTIQDCDLETVVDFLLQHFFSEEPLGKMLQLDPEIEVKPWFSRMVEHQIKERVSIVVRDSCNGNIAAVCLNDVERKLIDPEDVTLFSSVKKDQHATMWKIIRLLEDLVQDVDLFDAYNVDAFVVLQILSVSDRYTGRGLAKKLIQLTESVAKQLQYSLIMSEATSDFSGRAFHKAGFVSRKSISYQSYSLDGIRPFCNNGVHQKAELMVKHFA